jgi:hypothetical protein
MLAQATDPLFRQANYVEAGLWLTIGVISLAVAGRRAGRVRRRCLRLAATMLAVGPSDLVEAHTGAWWTPWWLLVWKGLCLLVLLALFAEYVWRQWAENRARRKTAA